MKEFLKKYMSAESLQALEDAYVQANEGAKGLPVYISKSRLDEVLGQKKKLEEDLQAAQDGLEPAKKAAVDAALAEQKTSHDKIVAGLKRDIELNEAIYKAKGKNAKAIRALIDPEKPVDEEIARLQKDEGYLFDGDDEGLPEGTGKHGAGGASAEEQRAAMMRKAVGI